MLVQYIREASVSLDTHDDLHQVLYSMTVSVLVKIQNVSQFHDAASHL
jgi:hypothetical protein